MKYISDGKLELVDRSPRRTVRILSLASWESCPRNNIENKFYVGPIPVVISVLFTVTDFLVSSHVWLDIILTQLIGLRREKLTVAQPL